jgi:enediyne polyketide synthase
VQDDHRLLDDLLLNSIVVGQIVAEAAARLGLPRVTSPTDFADATLRQVAQALGELLETKGSVPDRELECFPPGVDS